MLSPFNLDMILKTYGYQQIEDGIRQNVFVKGGDGINKIVVVLNCLYKDYVFSKDNILKIEDSIARTAPNILPGRENKFLFITYGLKHSDKVKGSRRDVVYFSYNGRDLYGRYDPCFAEEIRFLKDRRIYDKAKKAALDLGNREMGGYPIVTLTLILSCIFLYLYVKDPMKYAVSLQAIVNGNLAYLFTYAFFHAGLLHLFWNMVSLKVIGDRLESEVGHIPFAIIAMFSSIYGALISFMYRGYIGVYNIRTVGMSGAIYGMIGGLLVMRIRDKRGYATPIIYVAISVFSAMIFPSSTDVVIHVASFFSGMFITLCYEMIRKIRISHAECRVIQQEARE